ncbi:MAG TPA: R3H domain-containing nucleic acid-binding protein [Candidatus Cybelea sp.]|nr:R3H domain-containing nucleic acid-binding protein [Candidatus Cybelea sp.]
MLYEDDFEFEEQPADVRDRAIGGKPGGGRGGGTRGRREPRRGPPPSRPRHEMPDDAKPAHGLLLEILQQMGFGPVDIDYIRRTEGEYLEITGPHLATLIGRHGNTLEALNLIFNNAFNAGVRANRRYYTIDAEGYRAHRADQLKNLALAMLERTMRERAPQKLEPMLPSERKIIHLVLADSGVVRTESEGEEPERRVVIFPK